MLRETTMQRERAREKENFTRRTHIARVLQDFEDNTHQGEEWMLADEPEWKEVTQSTVSESEKPPFSYTVLEDMRARRRRKQSADRLQENIVWKGEQKRKTVMSPKIEKASTSEFSQDTQNGWQMRRDNVLDRVSTLFNNPTMSDVQFRIGDKVIPGHKFMLAAASPVFYTRFYETMTQITRQSIAQSFRSRRSTFVAHHDGASTIIEVTGVAASSFFEFMRFIYTDQITVTLENTYDLSLLADDYRIAGLHERVMEFLGSVVTVPDKTFICLGILRRIFLKQVLYFWRDLIESRHAGDDRHPSRSASMCTDRRSPTPGGDRSQCASSLSWASNTSKGSSKSSNPTGFMFSRRCRTMSYKLAIVIKDLNVLCWEAIERETEGALASKAFLEADHDHIQELLERKRCSIPEIALFRAIVRWTDVQCRKRRLTENGVNRRACLGEKALRHLRFPAMTKEQIQWEVVPTGLLAFEDVHPLLHYKDSPAAASFLRFSCNARSGNEVRDLPVNKDRQSLRPLRPTTPLLDPEDDEIDQLLSSALFRNELRRQNEGNSGNEVFKSGLMTRRLPGAAGGVCNRPIRRAEDFERVAPGLYRYQGKTMLSLCIEGGEVMVYDVGTLDPGEPVDVDHFSRMKVRGTPLSAFL